VRPARFEVHWREGTRKRSKTFTRRRDAERYDAETKRRLELGEPVIRRQDVPTLEELAEAWMNRRMKSVDTGELALGTFAEQAALLDRYIIPELGHLHLIDLRRVVSTSGLIRSDPMARRTIGSAGGRHCSQGS
jgi:hypothetical protein